ncbi:MAG: hypothetical protein AAB544_00935 [Patescibacteria group bacterium]
MQRFFLQIDSACKVLDFENERAELLLAEVKDALRTNGLLEIVNQFEDEMFQWKIHLEGMPDSSNVQEIVESYSQRLQEVSLSPIDSMDERQCYSSENIRAIQQHNKHRGIVLMHGALPGGRSLLGDLENRLYSTGGLSKGKETPRVDREKQKQFFSSQDQFDLLVDEYESLEVNDEIDDATIRRICAAMNSCNLKTHHSCEGHGSELPCILFEPVDAKALTRLHGVLKSDLRLRWLTTDLQFGLNDKERIELFRTNKRNEASKRISGYSLEPVDKDCELQSAVGRYDDSILDLDLIGLKMLQRCK